jgi:hypothetical protein
LAGEADVTRIDEETRALLPPRGLDEPHVLAKVAAGWRSRSLGQADAGGGACCARRAATGLLQRGHFQHALAWALQQQNPEAQLRLEIPLAEDAAERLDVLVAVDGLRLGIELKYPRDTFHVEIDGEPVPYRRNNPSAIDFARYHVAQDLKRLEALVEHGLVDVARSSS